MYEEYTQYLRDEEKISDIHMSIKMQ